MQHLVWFFSSLYKTCLSSFNLCRYTKAWGMRTTDLNQGVVYGVATEETMMAGPYSIHTTTKITLKPQLVCF